VFSFLAELVPVTSASPKRRESRACGEIDTVFHNLDKKLSICAPHYRAFTWKKLTEAQGESAGLRIAEWAENVR